MHFVTDFFDIAMLLGAIITGVGICIWILSRVLPEQMFYKLMRFLTFPLEALIKSKRIFFPQIVASIVFLKELTPEHDYISVSLRWLCLFAFILLIVHSLTNQRKGWTRAFVILAVVYNPFIPIHLGSAIWFVINIITIVIMLSSIAILEDKIDPAHEE